MTMACGSCGGRRAINQKYTWTSAPDAEGNVITQTYPNEIMARAKQLRVGGTIAPATATSTPA